ncbi:MAG TPA: VOC family protein [Candidatus Dormibacteraeota bacterium]
MITGVHALMFSRDADAVRRFLRDVLEFPSVDAGDGWLIFALPPSELGVHPTEEAGHHELYLMCDDIDATVATLRDKGVEVDGEITERGFGRAATIILPDSGRLVVYQPAHPTAT